MKTLMQQRACRQRRRRKHEGGEPETVSESGREIRNQGGESLHRLVLPSGICLMSLSSLIRTGWDCPAISSSRGVKPLLKRTPEELIAFEC
ncbi:MAG: hypothetical protein ACLUDL_20985 [Eubacterium callanderi]|uniref:hypothetical protein n=1 Tax=Eubacterium callanderi TaxID=53442 RepID=UPI003994DBD0